MKKDDLYEDEDIDTFPGWVAFILAFLCLCFGLKIDFFPLWFPPACYFAAFGLFLCNQDTDDPDDTSATSESAIRKQSQP